MEIGYETEETPDACEKGMREKSDVVEHSWENHHPIHREETSAGPWQKRSPAHPVDTLRGALQVIATRWMHLHAHCR